MCREDAETCAMRSMSMLVLAAALFLGGCENLVFSEKPLFSVGEAVGARAVRPGWWMETAPECRVDLETSSTTWPDCANIVLVPENWKGSLWASDGTEHMLVGGDPMIAQYQFRTSEAAAVPSQNAYLYFGVSALERDVEGRAVVLRYWPTLCGPSRVDHPTAATRRPWVGLRMKREGGCIAGDVHTLRKAVELSRAQETSTPTLRWLRAWRPGDQSEEAWLAAQGIRTH
jgi:hypothetical protein